MMVRTWSQSSHPASPAHPPFFPLARLSDVHILVLSLHSNVPPPLAVLSLFLLPNSFSQVWVLRYPARWKQNPVEKIALRTHLKLPKKVAPKAVISAHLYILPVGCGVWILTPTKMRYNRNIREIDGEPFLDWRPWESEILRGERLWRRRWGRTIVWEIQKWQGLDSRETEINFKIKHQMRLLSR